MLFSSHQESRKTMRTGTKLVYDQNAKNRLLLRKFSSVHNGKRNMADGRFTLAFITQQLLFVHGT